LLCRETFSKFLEYLCVSISKGAEDVIKIIVSYVGFPCYRLNRIDISLGIIAVDGVNSVEDLPHVDAFHVEQQLEVQLARIVFLENLPHF
jgi:hypothetical protein